MKSLRLPVVILDVVAEEVALELDVEQRIRMRDQIRAAVIAWSVRFDQAQVNDILLRQRRKEMS